jgi:hypothetical protein
MREIQTDTETIWAERRQLHDDISLMASSLVDLVNAAAARLPPPARTETEEETRRRAAADRTEPAPAAPTETSPIPPTVHPHNGGDDQDNEQQAKTIASAPGTQPQPSPAAALIHPPESASAAPRDARLRPKRRNPRDKSSPGRPEGPARALGGRTAIGVALPPGHTNHGEHVFEVGRPRRERRSGGKTDALDAVRPGPSLFEHPPLTT